MPLSVYMDVHVPLAITEGLRRRGINVLTCQDDETTEEDDEFLLDRPERRDFVHAVSALARGNKTGIVKLTRMGIVYIIEQYSKKR